MVLDASLDIMNIRTWLLFQLWVVELILGKLGLTHMPPIKPKQMGQTKGSVLQFPKGGGQAQHHSPQPGAFSPLPSPSTSISTYFE